MSQQRRLEERVVLCEGGEDDDLGCNTPQANKKGNASSNACAAHLSLVGQARKLLHTVTH